MSPWGSEWPPVENDCLMVCVLALTFFFNPFPFGGPLILAHGLPLHFMCFCKPSFLLFGIRQGINK